MSKYEDMAEKLLKERELKESSVNELLKMYPGLKDGKLDRFLGGIEQVGNGLFATAHKYLPNGSKEASEDLEKRNKDIDKRSQNFSEVNRKIDVANVAGNMTGYIPEFALAESKAVSIPGRMLIDGLKFGGASYGLDRLYNKSHDEALSNGLVAGGGASALAGLLGLFGKTLGKSSTVKSSKTSTKDEPIQIGYNKADDDVIEAEIIEEIKKLRSVSSEFNKGTRKLKKPQNKITNSKGLPTISLIEYSPLK